ncbi:unnamed protein product [Sphagnum balticum]
MSFIVEWFKIRRHAVDISLKKCATYDEHNLTIEQLAARFPASQIDVAHPAKSRGLDRSVAQLRLTEDGPVGCRIRIY